MPASLANIEPAFIFRRADQSGHEAARRVPATGPGGWSAQDIGVSLSGNSTIGRWMKKKGIAQPGLPRGLWYAIPKTYHWTDERRMAYAVAFATVLRLHDIPAYASAKHIEKEK